ncbi:MAG: cls [Cyanobacteria bacterium RYN_339]|nr:cls [Cyanobacteria bacterium RYN_339]
MLESSIERLTKNAISNRRTVLGKELAEKSVKTAGKQVVARDVIERTAKAADTLPSKAERAVMKSPTLRNKVTLHVSPESSQEALIQSIKDSKNSFYIETFIWHNDAAGNEVIQALADRVAKAKANGETYDAKVLIDWFGLRQGTGGTGDPLIVDKLRAGGVEVIEFARGYMDEGHLIPITHRKLYIQDGRQFMTGGRNIGDEYLKPEFNDPKGGHQNSWHDLLYTVEGDETGRILDQFFDNWKRAGGKEPAVKPVIEASATGRARVESFITNPHTGVRSLAKAHLDLIANAESEIVVMYPYLSDDKLVAALRDAKRKNPKLVVKVILPANKEVTAEGSIYQLLNKESARQLMKEGIEVRMFAGGVVDGKAVERFSHFKGLIVDKKVVSIGSANGDYRTFHSNHELNTVIADNATARNFLDEVVDPDWAAAVPVTQADLKADSLWTRIKQHVLEALDNLL